MYSLAIITVSDKCSLGESEDISGKLIEQMAAEYGFEKVLYKVVPDEIPEIQLAISSAAEQNTDLILTTGGTGFSVRDVTPEATKEILQKECPGISEALRQNSFAYTDRAILSRGVSGIIGLSLVVNLPGSPKAVKESIAFLLPKVGHGIDILKGSASECGRGKL